MSADALPLAELSKYAVRVRMSAANERWEAARMAYHLRTPEDDREALLAAFKAAETERLVIKTELLRRGRAFSEAQAKAGAERRERNRIRHVTPTASYMIDPNPPKPRKKRRGKPRLRVRPKKLVEVGA